MLEGLLKLEVKPMHSQPQESLPGVCIPVRPSP